MRIALAAVLLVALTACTDQQHDTQPQHPNRITQTAAPPPPPPPASRESASGYVHPILRSTRPAAPADAMRNPDIPPHVINSVEPKYTPEALKQRIEGIVIVETIIENDGRVLAARVLKPLPAGLDRAALEAVRHYRFDPGIHHGKPVRVLYNVTVRFSLPK